MKIKKDIIVDAPVDIVYAAWHNFENFPSFMHNIEEVRVVSGGRSHWKAKGPLGTTAEWDAEMTLDENERAIGWRSIAGSSSVMTGGRVNFEAIVRGVSQCFQLPDHKEDEPHGQHEGNEADRELLHRHVEERHVVVENRE